MLNTKNVGLGGHYMFRSSSFESRVAVAVGLALVAGLAIVWAVVALLPAA
jgi:hypothetical protein